MAILVTADIPGGTEQQDLDMTREMNLSANPPKGFICKAGGAIPGGWRIISLWESREAFEQFFRERIQPAANRMGRPPALMEFLEVTNVEVGRQAVAAVR